MNKVELEAKIEALQAALDTKTQEQNAYQGQIDALKKQLEDINKPKLTPKQFDELRDAIETGVGQFDFDDQDQYSIDFGLDYDNRICCESFSFDNAYDLTQEIYSAVEELFAEVEDVNQENQD
jgi:archaellum component FlaC|tara:strand:- start:278 stop:646 length:369 start_codon:yes stop_codon:yes gene_type:complete